MTTESKAPAGAGKPEEMGEEALGSIAGGFNPQPDPPGKAKVVSTDPGFKTPDIVAFKVTATPAP